jgi:hypothetical protein
LRPVNTFPSKNESPERPGGCVSLQILAGPEDVFRLPKLLQPTKNVHAQTIFFLVTLLNVFRPQNRFALHAQVIYPTVYYMPICLFIITKT